MDQRRTEPSLLSHLLGRRLFQYSSRPLRRSIQSEISGLSLLHPPNHRLLVDTFDCCVWRRGTYLRRPIHHGSRRSGKGYDMKSVIQGNWTMKVSFQAVFNPAITVIMARWIPSAERSTVIALYTGGALRCLHGKPPWTNCMIAF